jgi:hypothetical protein
MNANRELRAQLRALAAKVPPGISTWGHGQSVRFKDALRAAHRAADHPMAGRWVLEQALRDLKRFHEASEARDPA